MVVQHNLTAMNANRMLGVTTGQQAKSSEKLSSGYRINRAADDAAGLTISEKMRKQIKGLDQASTNAQDGVSAVQTAEGALTEVHSMLQRMNELAVQASNGTNSKSDREAIQAEIDQLNTEIDRVSETTKFNEIYLLKGDANGTTATKNLEAHDAGIKGKLENVDDTTATLTVELKAGESVSIAGESYTILKDGETEDKENNKISTDTAARMIQAELKAANDIGATKTPSAVTYSSESVQTIESATDVTAKGAMVAYNKTTGELKNIADGENISELIGNKDITLYKEAATGVTLDTSDKAKSGILLVHKDGAASGVEKQYAAGDAVSAAEKGISAVTNNKATADTANKYALYEEINLVSDTKTEASHEAYAEISTGANTKSVYDISFEALGTDAEKANKIVEGQNALKNEIAKISYTWDGTSGAFSHSFTDSKLDIDKSGVVSYDGTKIATITASQDGTTTQVAGTDQLGTAQYIDAQFKAADGADTYTFTITKGQTESAADLSFNLHVGADADMTNKINVKIEAMSTEYLGIKGLNVTDNSGVAATYAIDAIADAVAKVSSQRSALGAVQNRLEHTIANLDNVVENTTSAESRIRDTDMAEEMVEYSKNNILAQAGQSMLAQANQSTQGVLSLLQ